MKADSLRKALSHFTATEELDGGERQYQCSRCKEKVRATKRLTVHNAPFVLTIHLKRFGPDVPGQKIDKKVDFEPTLDLKPFVSDKQVSRFSVELVSGMFWIFNFLTLLLLFSTRISRMQI